MQKTLCAPSKCFAVNLPAPSKEPFRPDRIVSAKQPLTDDRSRGSWDTRYPWQAWIQIVFELLYLTFGLIICLILIYQIGAVSSSSNGPKLIPDLFVGFSKKTLSLAAVAIGGACGGFAFALKWLYHGVAHGWWNQDRVVWRVVVPLLSGTLALFTALMIGSGIIPLFSTKIAEGPRIGAAFGFFVGFFTDNLLALLQKFANQTLGTLGRIEVKPDDRSEP